MALTASMVLAASSQKIEEQVNEFITQGNFTEADRQVDSALAVTPDDYHLLTAKGNILLAQDKHAEALAIYEQALEHKDKYPDALYGAGTCALKVGENEKALDYFERGVKTKKRKSEFIYGKAIAQKELGELAEADKTIRKAIKDDDKNAALHRAFGDINYAKEVWSFAMDGFKKSLELEPNQTDLYYKIARANLMSHNFTESVKWYKDYLKINDTDIKAWKELSDICVAAKLPNEAVFCYKKLTELEPENGEFWYTLGDLYFSLRQYEDAGISLEKSVSYGFNVAESYKRLAKVYQLREEYYRADSAYTRYENEMGEPDEAEYWYDKGKVMIKIGTKDAAFFNRAVSAFDKAIALDSTVDSYWEYAGLARYYKQDYRGAIPFFIKRIEFGGENVNSLRNLAFCYLKTENYNKAAEALEKAIALKPDDAVMRKMVGKIYIFLSRENPDIVNKAIPHLKVAINSEMGALKPAEKCESVADLGYCYVALREPKNAILYLEQAYKCMPKDVDNLMNLASSYHLDNQIDLANEFYNKVLDIEPNNKAAKEGALRTKKR